ncbi:MAG: YciI family protein [Vulcanimicrobiaceae bacterium]
MKYMLLIYGDPTVQPASEAARDALLGEFVAYTDDLRKRGLFVDGNPLVPPASATTVRIRNGSRAVTDGPFAETKEFLGGYILIEAASLDQALEAAATCPGAKFGSVEIRPIAVLS